MELTEAIKKEREKISEVLKPIGYFISGTMQVSNYSDGDQFITLVIRKEKEDVQESREN